MRLKSPSSMLGEIASVLASKLLNISRSILASRRRLFLINFRKWLSLNLNNHSWKACPPSPESRTKPSAKVKSRRASVAAATTSAPAASRIRSKQFASAVHAYEAGLKAVHGEDFERAKKILENLITGYPDEPEIQERAKVLVSVCEKKIHEKARTVLRSADDHYNIGIAYLNRRELDSALHHLQQALKLAPKADHILYAL